MKKTDRKLRLNPQTLKLLGNDKLGNIAGGLTGQLTDVPPNCGTFNC
ncbi:MAG TPA: hypothetical protein VGC42_13870 [Kofleriaceae bacterium]